MNAVDGILPRCEYQTQIYCQGVDDINIALLAPRDDNTLNVFCNQGNEELALK